MIDKVIILVYTFFKSMTNIIPITQLRRNFGRITAGLARLESITLTRGGKPFAILTAAPEQKMKLLHKAAGVWKGSKLDSDTLWKEVAKRKSRKTPITI